MTGNKDSTPPILHNKKYDHPSVFAPENLMTYFRNLILTDMPTFNIIPANHIDDLFWNTAIGLSDDLLHKPVAFHLPQIRNLLFKQIDEKTLKDVLYDVEAIRF